jgi:hypothetical protein
LYNFFRGSGAAEKDAKYEPEQVATLEQSYVL